MHLVDANVILRYLLDDDPLFAEKATKILEQGQAYAPFEVIAEVVYVMQGVYNASRQDISQALSQLISFQNISTTNEPVLMEALRLYVDKRLDFVDSLLCGYSRVEGARIETFDKKLRKCCSEAVLSR
jgi:predicted nucleic-acid-binding protein